MTKDAARLEQAEESEAMNKDLIPLKERFSTDPPQGALGVVTSRGDGRKRVLIPLLSLIHI